MAYTFDKKMKKSHLALLALLLGLSAAAQAATIVISQPTSTSLADYSPTGFGQSFTANGTYSITAINLFISSSAGGSDITLRLYDFDSLASTLGSVVRGSGILLESSLSPTAAWKTVTLATPVNVTSGATYAFTIIAKDPGGSATGWNNYGVNSADVYAGGNRLNIGSGSSVSKQVSDLRFQVVAVPEPSTLLIFAAAVTITATRRTRRGWATPTSPSVLDVST
jgi:hypothetical protein